MLVNRLQSMDPVDSNDSAPGVLVIDLYETVIHIMQDNDILESVIGQEAEMHGGENADNIDGDSDEWPHLQEDDFYQALAGMFDVDAGELKDALANQYQDAAAEQRAHIVFLTGIGPCVPVYPRARPAEPYPGYCSRQHSCGAVLPRQIRENGDDRLGDAPVQHLGRRQLLPRL